MLPCRNTITMSATNSTIKLSWVTVFSYLAEGFGDVGLHLPVHRPPHFEAVVVGLGGDVFPYWVPRQTFNQPSVSSQTCYHLWRHRHNRGTQMTSRPRKNSCSVSCLHTWMFGFIHCDVIDELWFLCPTWEFASVPDHDGVVDAAGGQPHVMRRPRHVHHICKQNTHTHTKITVWV